MPGPMGPIIPGELAREPIIFINGTRLTEAQAMAVRVAVTDFRARLTTAHMKALGEIGPLYKSRVEEVLALLLEP